MRAISEHDIWQVMKSLRILFINRNTCIFPKRGMDVGNLRLGLDLLFLAKLF